VDEDKADQDQEEEWLRQSNVIYGGLLGVGIILIQPFLTADELDVTATVCVYSFAVAIPLLAALVLVNQQEAFRRRATGSLLVGAAKAVGQTAAFAGVVAAFWHISWIAGVVLLVSGLVGVGIHSAGYTRLEQDGRSAT
jgi:hypothetical protein